MGLEYELKFIGPDLDALRARLAAAGAHRKSEAYFERNLVFDLPGRTLKAAGTLLRLRLKGGEDAVLCVKRPVKSSGLLKAYEEHQTTVGSFEATRELLEGLGYRVALTYEKVREKWVLGEVEACLDTLPFGDFVELEGAEEDVLAAAEKLGLSGLTTSRATYHDLNREHRSQNGLPADESFVFPEGAFKESFNKSLPSGVDNPAKGIYCEYASNTKNND